MDTNQVRSFVAGGTITEYAVVSLDTAGKVQVTTGPTDFKVIGVAQRAASSGEVVEVLVYGFTRVIAGDTLTFATAPILAATTDGKLQAAEAGDTTFYPVCRVIPNINQISAADGEQIEVFFFGPTTLV